MSCPTGYIFHWSSRKLVHPDGGSPNPANGTKLVVHSDKNDPSRLQVRFVPMDGAGHFGYIEHVSSSKIVHPYGGSIDPDNGTQLVYHSDRHVGALFGFDEENQRIMHKGGKIWHPEGGSPNPSNNTHCVVHSDRHDGAKFYFGDINGTPMSPYPAETLSGDWKIVKAFITPEASHTYTITYKTGRLQTKSVTTHQAWSVSAKAAYGIFSGSATYSGYVEKTDSTTWSEEKEVTSSVTVEQGSTTVVWQYVFAMGRYGDELSFQSNIIGDTNSLSVKPQL